MTTPRVTVAVPVYNRRELTLKAVRSALAQPIDGLDVLAVDDRSTDDVWDALHGLSDRRLRLVRNDANLGLFGNFNRCLDLARGEFVRLLCCDDALTPGTLAAELAAVADHPGVAVLSTRGRLVRADGTPVATFARHLSAGVYPGRDAIRTAVRLHADTGFNPFNYPSGVLLRRTAVEAAGRFDPAFRVAGDVDYFLRLLRHGDLLVLDRVGCEILHHDGQVNRALMREAFQLSEQAEIARRNADLLGGEEAHVRRQIAGLALGWEGRYRLRGDTEAAAAYRQVRRTLGVGVGRAAVGLARTIGQRLLRSSPA